MPRPASEWEPLLGEAAVPAGHTKEVPEKLAQHSADQILPCLSLDKLFPSKKGLTSQATHVAIYGVQLPSACQPE